MKERGIFEIVVVLWFFLSCSGPSPGSAVDEKKLDFNYYACVVEPVLVKRCSFLACHGSNRPFRIYSISKFRMNPHPTLYERSNTPLSCEEITRNYESAMAFTKGVSTILNKAIPQSDGGVFHKPGPMFRSSDDAEYKLLLQWVNGATLPSCKKVEDACGNK